MLLEISFIATFTVSVQCIDIVLCGGFNTLTKSTLSEVVEFYVMCKLLPKPVCRNYCACRKREEYYIHNTQQRQAMFCALGKGRPLGCHIDHTTANTLMLAVVLHVGQL